jgi:hypothetical protein
VAIFKFLLLHPILGLIRAGEDAGGVWMLALASLSFVAAIVLSMTVGILAFLDNEG